MLLASYFPMIISLQKILLYDHFFSAHLSHTPHGAARNDESRAGLNSAKPASSTIEELEKPG